ncbi:MAG: methyltransferase domain-containing protein [candidate division Zixibacteria bacterium]|nr:methyltransferase domain-containing protein [candidate division Zixibacteria bacterium]MDD5425144.1 methyltransferase domain-containing protein [candidate division Zixibacteria bacterium]
MAYDDIYSRVKDYFGSEPTGIVREHYTRIDKKRPVLDIGTGQGRNAFFLARKGYIVDAIDPSRVAIDTVANIAEKENLPISANQCGFENFIPLTDFYSAILLIGLIQILSWTEINILLKNISTWTSRGSLIFVTAFTVEDPSYEKTVADFRKIGNNSFEKDKKQVHTYLEPGEILTLFRNYKVVYHNEGLGAEHYHGDRPAHRHGMVEAVFLKTDKGEYIIE